MTKWPAHKQTHRRTHKHVEHQDATDIQKSLNRFLQEMLSYRLGIG